MMTNTTPQNKNSEKPQKTADLKQPAASVTPEIGGYKGQDPTTHGDWQHKGRTTDF